MERTGFGGGTGANADLCYDHIYLKSKVVACYSLTRQ